MRELELIGIALGLYFWVQMLRLCLTREPRPLERIAWLLFMIFVPGLGSLIYFFVRVPALRA